MSSAGITCCCLIDFNKVQQLKDSGPFGINLSFKLSKSKSTLLISVESLICLGVSQRKARSSFSEGLLLPRSLKAIPSMEALTRWQRMGTFVPLRFPLCQVLPAPAALSWRLHLPTFAAGLFPGAQPHNGVVLSHFFPDLCFPRSLAMIYHR